MNSYYLTLILNPDLEEKALLEFLNDKIKKVISGSSTSLGTGDEKVVSENMWGIRNLAYPIEKQKKGFYAHFEFETEPKVVKALDKSLKLEENILRFLLVRV